MKPINSSKHIRPMTRLCSDHANMNPIRQRIQRDCNNHKPVTRNVDPEAVRRRREREDRLEAMRLGISYEKYMEDMK